LACTPFEGKIVQVTAAETILDDHAVADSMLGDKFFTSPDDLGALLARGPGVSPVAHDERA
jgi:hypothetical protein